jgi:hypothetical protein
VLLEPATDPPVPPVPIEPALPPLDPPLPPAELPVPTVGAMSEDSSDPPQEARINDDAARIDQPKLDGKILIAAPLSSSSTNKDTTSDRLDAAGETITHVKRLCA